MTPHVQVTLEPSGRTLEVVPGTALHDVLFTEGVEFPCGGLGRCKGCRIRVLEGRIEPSPEDRRLLAPAELAAGWRLACRAAATTDLRIELGQWEAVILADESPVEVEPRDGIGIAIDLGTTTIVGQLLDLRTGRVLAVRSALNVQARHGADIMSRIAFAVQGGQVELGRLIREQIGRLVADLLASAPGRADADDVVLVGNTAMHQIFSGIDVSPLAGHPFEPADGGLKCFEAAELGWAGQATVRFLPCLGGLVGSDVLAGILATRLHASDRPAALIDLGTNGEIVVGDRHQLWCASAAAGPAFEGARISMGMRAATGAISEVRIEDGRYRCHVLGGGEPRGVCGSGLIDAVACALDLGLIRPDGRMVGEAALALAPPVVLLQGDIRELQLAKGAIAAALRLLARRQGISVHGLERVHLAGAFGNYVNRRSARRIGLFELPEEQVIPSGNSALLGAKLALLRLPSEPGDFTALRAQVRHVSLNEEPDFQDVFVEALSFPAAAP